MHIEINSWSYTADWIALVIASGAYFYFIVSCGDAEFKRKWSPYLTIAINLLALTMAVWTLGSWGTYYPLIAFPIFLLSSYLMITMTKFCNGCGSAAPTYNSFRDVACCQKCKKQFIRSKA